MNPLSYGGIVTVIGLVIVFFGMTILIGLLVLMAQIFKSLDRKKKAAAEAVKPAEAPAPVPVPEETGFMKMCKSTNTPTIGGVDMLIYQAVIAYEFYASHSVSYEDISKMRKETGL